MNIFSLLFFLLGVVSAGLFAIGMDPYSCGIPLCFVGAALVFSCYRGDFAWIKTWAAWIVLLAAGYFAVRMWQSPIQDFGRSDGLLLAGALGAFVWTMSQKYSLLRWLIFVLWGLLIANVIVAMVQAYIDVDFYLFYAKRATLTFPSGLYLHYNHFANFLLGVGLLSLGMAFDSVRSIALRVTALIMYFAAVYGIVLSNSRGAMLGLGCGSAFCVVGWLSNLLRRKVSWAGIALVIATLLAPLVVTGAWHLGSKTLENRQEGDSGRLEFASMALDLIAERPLWGGGSRAFFFDSVKKWNPKEMYVGTGEIEYVHNEYLQTAVDYGLVGALLLFVVFCFALFRGMTYLAMADNDQSGDSGFALGAMGALVAMGVQAFFSFVYHVLPDVMLMSVCLALLLRQPWVLSLECPEVGGYQRRGWLMPVLVVFVGAALIGFSARDGIAWCILQPRFEKSRTSAQRIIALDSALKVRPDFRVLSDMSEAIIKSYSEEESSTEERKQLVEKAISVQQEVVKRAPQSYQGRVNLALMYDAIGRYEEAAPIYEQIVDDLDPRERFYGTRHHYTSHLLSRAHMVWRKREPERALVLFLRAREQAGRIQHGYEGTNLPAIKEEIEKCIKFLEGANIQPREHD